MKKLNNIKKIKKIILITFLILISLAIIGTATVFGINEYVKSSVSDLVLTEEEASSLEDVDCIMVLGCGVYGDSPSPLLRYRLNKGVELFDDGVSGKLLMSGDHGRNNYDEVSVMKQFAIDAEISSEDVFMDHAGFSTYESMYRAKEIFGVKKMVIVTQEYHLSRALYIANELGIEAYGVCTDYTYYAAQKYWDAREVLARVKDFFYTIFKPQPTYLGDTIDIKGDGNITNDGTVDF